MSVIPVGVNRGIIIGVGDIIPGITVAGDVMFVIGVNPGWPDDWFCTPRPPPLIVCARVALVSLFSESFTKIGWNKCVM